MWTIKATFTSRIMSWKTLISIIPLYIGVVVAQVHVGGSQEGCGASDAFQYLGCYSNADNTPNAGFTWQLSSDPLSAQYYPGYNDSVTADFCKKACRGHGFKYAALANQSDCFCGSVFPNPKANVNAASGIVSYYGNHPGAASDRELCQIDGHGCSGDSSQFCGSSSGTDVYVDPSISNSSTSRQVSNFAYLGCFSDASPGIFYVTLDTPSTSNCTTYCGQLGYAYAGLPTTENDNEGKSVNGLSTCGCGSELQTGTRVDEGKCTSSCEEPPDAL